MEQGGTDEMPFKLYYKLCVSFIGMGCQGCGGTQHSHSNFHTSSGGSCPPLHSQQQREGSQMKSLARRWEPASWLMWPPSSRWYTASGEARSDQGNILGAVRVSPAPRGRCRGHKGIGDQTLPLRTWASWQERMGTFNPTNLGAGTYHGNSSLTTRIGATDVYGRFPPLRFLLLFPCKEHFFTSRDTLLSKQLRSQPGQTDVPLLPLTRT